MTDKEQKDKTGSLSFEMSFIKLVFLKTEKLTSALYLVTNALSDQEPLKWLLRDKALNFFLAIKFWTEQATAPNSPGLWPNELNRLDELVSLLEFSRSLNSVSAINLEVVKNEFSVLKRRILDYDGGPIKREEIATPVAVKPVLPSSKKTERTELRKQNAELKNQNRRETIVNFLLGKPPQSIKDISRSLPAVSGKTVQRELSALVEAGKVKREGDRRWSRYGLV